MRKFMMIYTVATIATFGLSSAQTFSTIYNFPQGGPPLGSGPDSLIAGPAGTLLGTTEGSGYGAVFQLTAPATPGGAWTESTIYDFQDDFDGFEPGGIIYRGSAIYGWALRGGQDGGYCGEKFGCGVIFRLTPPTTPGNPWNIQPAHIFRGGLDGVTPLSLITGADGSLYGTTEAGGQLEPTCFPQNTGCGVVFQLTPPAVDGDPWTENILYAFQSTETGYSPQTLMLGRNGALFGTTEYGVVFELTPPSQGGAPWSYSTLYTFIIGNQGGILSGSLAQGPSGQIYGVQYGSGAVGAGDIWELDPPSGGVGAWTEQTLYSFTGQDLPGPNNGVARGAHGALFGTTIGGFNGEDYSDQTVYVLKPPSDAEENWTYQLLHTFPSGPNFVEPEGTLVLAGDNTLYGYTPAGGTSGAGTVYQLTY